MSQLIHRLCARRIISTLKTQSWELKYYKASNEHSRSNEMLSIHGKKYKTFKHAHCFSQNTSSQLSELLSPFFFFFPHSPLSTHEEILNLSLAIIYVSHVPFSPPLPYIHHFRLIKSRNEIKPAKATHLT